MFSNFPVVGILLAGLAGVVVTYLTLRPRLSNGPPLDNQAYIIRLVIPTLAFVIVAVTVSLLHGLYDERVDNTELLKIIGPAFQIIVGGFVGFLGGYAVARGDAAAARLSDTRPPAERPPTEGKP